MKKVEYANLMERRQFLKLAGLGALGATALAACSTGNDTLDEAVADPGLPEIEWELATSWPVALDTIYGGAETFANRVGAMTGGKFMIAPKPSGEIVPPLEILQSVQNGTIQAGHTASYYYVGLADLTAFGTALPFGLTFRQQNAWLYEGGGLEMMQEVYAERFNAIQFPAGNTGVQMGGWFRKPIRSLADLQGLKMRIPGLGGRVMERLGVLVQVLPGGEIFQALQTGAIDATEWVGPYDDTKLDFQSVTDFYYYPGWWEPGPSLEVQMPLDVWNGLPEEYQEVIKSAAAEANINMMATYDALNPPALADIVNNTDIVIEPFPDDVMQASEEAAFGIFDESAADDTDFASIFEAWKSFRSGQRAWHSLAENAMNAYQSQV